jgi:hypothetical protein
VRGLALVLAAFVFTAALPRPAQAQDKRTRARALLVEGQKLVDSGDYGEALTRFERAYALVPSPKIQFNFGLAYNGLDRPADALRAFQTFVAEAGDAAPANVAKAREYLARLAKKVGTLELDGDVSGVEVSVDGRSYGAATKVVVDPGPHQLTVDKAGKPTFLHRLTIAAGERQRISVRFAEPAAVVTAPPPTTLGPASPTLSGTPAPGGVALPPPVVTSPAMVTPNPAPEEPKETPPPAGAMPWQYTAGWVSAGIGAVLLGGGLGARLMANKKYADFNAYQDSRVSKCNKAAKPDYGGGPCRELLSSGDTYSLLSWVGVIGGGVAGVAAVLFFVSAPAQAAHAESAALTCAPTLGMPGATCRMTF